MATSLHNQRVKASMNQLEAPCSARTGMARADDTPLEERSRGAMRMKLVLTAAVAGPGPVHLHQRRCTRRTVSAHAPRGKPVLGLPDARQGVSLIVGLVGLQP